MPERYLNYIGGRWVPARSGQTFANRDPATGDCLGEYPSSDAADVNDAVEAAVKAYRSWRLTPAPKRAEILFRAGAIIRERKEVLARSMTASSSRPIPSNPMRKASNSGFKVRARSAVPWEYPWSPRSP